MKMLRRLTPRHWGWLHFKAAMLLWMSLLLIFTPANVYEALGWVVWLIASVTIFGTLTSMVGLVMSAQHAKVAVLGLSIELAGLWFTAAGPVAYLITQMYLALNLHDGQQRYALCALAYLVCAALACRIIIVAPRVRSEAHDETKPT